MRCMFKDGTFADGLLRAHSQIKKSRILYRVQLFLFSCSISHTTIPRECC